MQFGVHLVEKFPHVIPTSVLKADPVAAGIVIFKHTRLSIAPVTAPQALRLANEPKANVLRYDSLRIKAQAAMTIRAAQESCNAS